MGPSRFGHQPDTGFAVTCPQHTPIGDRLPTCFMANLLFGPVFPIDDDGQINSACLFGHLAPYTGQIGFLGLTFLKLQAQMPLRVRCQCKDHHARRIAI